MAQRTSINGSTWNQATGTPATAGTTGLNVCTGFTHVAAADLPVALPPGVAGVALGAIKTTAGSPGVFKLDATGHGGAASTKYTVKYWMLAYRTDPLLLATAAGEAGTQAMLSYTGTGANRNTWYMAVIRDANQPRDHSGLCLYMRNTNTGVRYAMHGAGDGGVFAYPNFQFERWGRVAHMLHTGASATADGMCALGIQGQYAARQTGITTDSIASIGNTTVTVPGFAGIEFYLVAFVSYDGTGDTEYTQAPDANGGQFITPANYDKTFQWSYYMSTGATATLAFDEGSNWYTSSGSQPTEAAYSSYSGNDGGRVNAKWVDQAASVQESPRKIGTLQYDAGTGWASLYFPDFQVLYGTTTTGITHTLTVYQSDNTTIVLRLVWDEKYIYLTSATVANRLAFRPSGRMALDIKFNSDNRVQLKVHRLSDAAPGTAVYDVFDMVDFKSLPNWTVTALGKVTYGYTGGGASAGSQTVEWGGMAQLRRPGKVGPDSFIQALSGGTGMTTSGNEVSISDGSLYFGGNLSGLRQCEGPHCPGYFIQPNNGHVWCIVLPVGWSGKTVGRMSKSHGRVLAAGCGDRYINVNGAPNSIGAATTPALADSLGKQLARELASFTLPMAINENYVDVILPWLGSTGGGYTTAGAANVQIYIGAMKAEYRRLASTIDASGRLKYCEPAGGYEEQVGNAPHLTAAGYGAVAAAAIASLREAKPNKGAGRVGR